MLLGYRRYGFLYTSVICDGPLDNTVKSRSPSLHLSASPKDITTRGYAENKITCVQFFLGC